jgi:hypothetical protein
MGMDEADDFRARLNKQFEPDLKHPHAFGQQLNISLGLAHRGHIQRKYNVVFCPFHFEDLVSESDFQE